jgi:hypothetical protein
MSALLKIRLLITFLGSLSIALWVPQVLSLIYSPMPRLYVSLLAGLGALAVTIGTVIGIKCKGPRHREHFST